MRIGSCLFFLLLGICSFSQNTERESFDVIFSRVKKSFFSNPKECLDDAFKMKARARNDKEKVVADQFIGYIYDLTGNVDSARYYILNNGTLINCVSMKNKEVLKPHYFFV